MKEYSFNSFMDVAERIRKRQEAELRVFHDLEKWLEESTPFNTGDLDVRLFIRNRKILYGLDH